ncbi:MAG: zf-TFIIB domain-containing protein [Quadrisphaera sp.]
MSTPTSPTLTCPKCHGAMRSYERNGVTIDQCTECRGIFLDRGELERLIDAEAAYYDDRPSAPQQPVQPQGQPYGQEAPSYSQPAYGADAHQQRTGSSAHGAPAPQGSGSDLGKLASEVFRQVSAARSSSSSSSSSQYGGKRKKSFLDQLLG